MLAKQKKLVRKEIKEDKLVEFYYKSRNFFEENKNKVFTYLVAVAVVVIAVILYMNYKSGQNEEAAIHLAKVMEMYDQGDFLGAIEGKKDVKMLGLKDIVAQYGSTENGETAKIYLANSYANLGKSDEALKYFEDYSGDIDIYQAAALAGQAGYLSVKNEYEKAADLYMKASKVSKNDVMNADYIFQAAVNYFEAGEKDQAKNLLQTIKDDYKTSSVYSQVDRYLSQLN
ncbi:MAG: tetratricopeptide repeat protein [Ignavibacteriaceae bacterium]|nr:tetratricopeptide repeat protein [Ignavibacterium sp.]MCC6255913.1 tetratricopeptide repeat protein [Ignavibacteriaceae bacterium]HMN24307.1 tetratricopeptide repeat protein [Ignavibacteriaceae bacterium]HRN24932.1 tetratricopeptide repeat protein [Ignavibacteriaceae bacterium]HRP93052.1 tetratricopeptide repeat protein [Ignavibacteriaceae bacterium]